MNKRSARPDVDANRAQYLVTEVTVGQKLWLEFPDQRNLIAVTVIFAGERTAIVKDGDGWDYVVDLTGFALSPVLYTHWFSLF